jgi:hypothetical protein
MNENTTNKCIYAECTMKPVNKIYLCDPPCLVSPNGKQCLYVCPNDFKPFRGKCQVPSCETQVF